MYRQDQDGYFWYQCRTDDLIICGGYNVAGPEIENVLIEHAAVLEAAVVASPDPVRGAVPKAFIVAQRKAGLNGDCGGNGITQRNGATEQERRRSEDKKEDPKKTKKKIPKKKKKKKKIRRR
jgi:acyl-coenzyme A synthetase/AMP-(fatty) acid ligase